MKALKCKPSAQFAYNYSISVLSKCSNIISHRSSIFEGQHMIDHRSSKVNTSSIDLRRSAHRSSKVDTLIFESRHIDHRSLKANTSISEGRHTHQSSKVNTSIFEVRHIDLQRSKAETSHRQFVAEYCPQWCSIVLYRMA